jgi:hypothetical protein
MVEPAPKTVPPQH